MATHDNQHLVQQVEGGRDAMHMHVSRQTAHILEEIGTSLRGHMQGPGRGIRAVGLRVDIGLRSI
jgi:hypothetical protein